LLSAGLESVVSNVDSPGSVGAEAPTSWYLIDLSLAVSREAFVQLTGNIEGLTPDSEEVATRSQAGPVG
jgi:hypothetical protein